MLLKAEDNNLSAEEYYSLSSGMKTEYNNNVSRSELFEGGFNRPESIGHALFLNFIVKIKFNNKEFYKK
jgi:hypothetical protein